MQTVKAYKDQVMKFLPNFVKQNTIPFRHMFGLMVILMVIIFLNYNSFLDRYVSRGSRRYIGPCLKAHRKLIGVQKFNKTGITWREIENKYGHTLSAGHYTPDCIIKTSVAIIIPYRDRQQHLKILVSTLHAMLQRQVVEYGIYVVAQTDSHPFNRGMLMNVGFLEAIKLHKYNCFIFHDVDLIPENDKNIYNCEGSPKHLSVAVSTFQYKLPYKYIFGGVNAMNKKDFEKVNGFSNRFFGWGGEDDDLYRRIIKNNLLLHRGPIQVSRYTMLRHNKNKPNTERVKILDDPEYENDGLNSVDYTVEELTSRTLFTYIKVKLETD